MITLKKLISMICPFFMVSNSQPAKEHLYIKNEVWKNEIYDKAPSNNIYPFVNIGIGNGLLDVPELCIVDFTGDEYYVAMELQKVHKDGACFFVAIMYVPTNQKNEDLTVDVYVPVGADIDEQDYVKMFHRVNINPCNLNASMNISDKGLELYLSFKDKYNRIATFTIKENRQQNDTFGLIAPIAANIKAPEFFPMIYLKKFNIALQKGTEVNFVIDNIKLKPKKLIPLCNFHRVFLIRYSFYNIIRGWNPNFIGTIEPYVTDKTSREFCAFNCVYEIEEINGYSTVKSVKSIHNGQELKIIFYPSLPDLESLKNEIDLSGNFSFHADEVAGILGGNYHIQKRGEKIKIKIHPVDGWQPMPGKKWMSTYLWIADITLLNNKIAIDSKWNRI